MAVYLVSYDLMKETRGSDPYAPLWDALRKLEAHKTQLSLWLVNLPNTAKEVHDHLKQFVDSNDRLWVAQISAKHYYSNAIAGTNDWLKKNSP